MLGGHSNGFVAISQLSGSVNFVQYLFPTKEPDEDASN